MDEQQVRQLSTLAFLDPSDVAKVTEYFEGGFGDTPLQNVKDWQRWRVRPKAFADVRTIDARATILGFEATAPLLVAPTHAHLLLHDEGAAATARGARQAGVPFVLSHGSGMPLSAIDGPYLQQLYLPEDRDLLTPFLDSAVAEGATAFVVTVDQAAAGGDEFRNDAAKVLAQVSPPNASILSSGRMQIARNIVPGDLTWLRDGWGLPVIAKGILDPVSARAAVDAGAAGVVVSNHGGRQLAHSVSPALVLEEIAAEVGREALVWADSGIRSGTDVFRAVALGADAVLLGRPVLRKLSQAGAHGVAEGIQEIINDFRVVMANAGTPSISDIDRQRLWPS